MKILIDIKHPAHVHFFKNFIKIAKKKGYSVLVTSRKKDITLDLLNKYNIEYINLSSIGNSKISLLKELIIRNIKFLKIAIKFKPDILLELMGTTAAPIGKLLNIPTLVFYDTENAVLTNFLAYNFSTKFITPNCYKKKLGKKNIRYNSYHELAYLHPKYFKPKISVLKNLGIKKSDLFTIIRFVSWGASHDIGHKGISDKMKIKIVNELSKYSKIFITSEKPLIKELEKYRLKLSVEDIHNLLYYATLLYGESATMASEAAVLGTHAIYLDNHGRGYTDEQEKKYKLVYNYSESKKDQLNSLKKAIEILKDKKSKNVAKEKRKKLLSNSTNLTELILKLVNQYAKSQY
jgi:uncharacterized protein